MCAKVEYMTAGISAVAVDDAGTSLSSDIEHSIVHELIHLHLRTTKINDETGRVISEAAINLIASALVKAYR